MAARLCNRAWPGTRTGSSARRSSTSRHARRQHQMCMQCVNLIHLCMIARSAAFMQACIISDAELAAGMCACSCDTHWMS
eukprot:4400862-Pleurochrysis_carterae.AAC.2